MIYTGIDRSMMLTPTRFRYRKFVWGVTHGNISMRRWHKKGTAASQSCAPLHHRGKLALWGAMGGWVGGLKGLGYERQSFEACYVHSSQSSDKIKPAPSQRHARTLRSTKPPPTTPSLFLFLKRQKQIQKLRKRKKTKTAATTHRSLSLSPLSKTQITTKPGTKTKTKRPTIVILFLLLFWDYPQNIF